MSAYWLSVSSFGPPMILLSLTVLWLERRSRTPPPFLAWLLAGWTVSTPQSPGRVRGRT